MSLEQTIKDLEALEESLKANGVDNLTEDQLKQLTDQLISKKIYKIQFC